MNPDYIATMNQETYDGLSELGRIDVLEAESSQTYVYRDDDGQTYFVAVHGGMPADMVTFVPTSFWKMHSHFMHCYETLIHKLAKIFDFRGL